MPKNSVSITVHIYQSGEKAILKMCRPKDENALRSDANTSANIGALMPRKKKNTVAATVRSGPNTESLIMLGTVLKTQPGGPSDGQ
jgi:hypothetical protein